MLAKITHILQFISEWSGRAVSWCTLLVVLLTFYVVVMRYVFNSGSIAIQELSMYGFAMIFLFGISYTLKYDEHVRVDIFYQKFSNTTKCWVNLFGHLFLLIPVAIFIFVMSFNYVQNSWAIHEESPEAGGLAYVYLLKSGILALSVLLLIESLAQILLQIQSIFCNTPQSEA